MNINKSKSKFDSYNECTNEERISLAMRGSNDGLWDWDLITNDVYYSPRWKSMLGYEEHEVENNLDSWKSLVHLDDKDDVLKKVKNYIEDQSLDFEIEMRMHHKDGSEVNVLSRAYLVKRESDNKAIRLIGTHVDITQRKKTEEHITNTNKILEMIAVGKKAKEVYDSIALMYESRHPGMRCSLLELSNGVLLHGGAPSMPKEYCNAVNGLKIGSNVGSCGTSTYTGKRVVVEDIKTDSNWKDIKQFALPHGMRSCWSEPIIDSTGKVLGAFGMYYNHPCLPNEEESDDLLSAARLASIVMERDQSQKRIYQDQKFIAEQSKLASMGEMIGNIAHQWRQPLSVISAVASGIQLNEKYKLNEKRDTSGDMKKIISQVDYLSQTIDDFRSFIKESKSRKNMSISKVINTTLNIMSASLKDSNITLVKNIEVDIKILGYKNELIQALINIINNAKDSIIENTGSQEDRYIFISTKEINKKLILEIKDNGLGIDEDIINRVFEPYFTTKHQSIGTGIGLSMAYQIVAQRHKGNITVSNSEFDYNGEKFKGACFSIYFNKI
jgi:PAS domain S-box-containing protein